MFGDIFGKGVIVKTGQTEVPHRIPELPGPIQEGRPHPDVIISHRMALAADGYKMPDNNQDNCRKIVLRPRSLPASPAFSTGTEAETDDGAMRLVRFCLATLTSADARRHRPRRQPRASRESRRRDRSDPASAPCPRLLWRRGRAYKMLTTY